jgi:hypothetical protein
LKKFIYLYAHFVPNTLNNDVMQLIIPEKLRVCLWMK